MAEAVVSASSFSWSLSDLTPSLSWQSWSRSGMVAALLFYSLLIAAEAASSLELQFWSVLWGIVFGSSAQSLFHQPFPCIVSFPPGIGYSEGARMLQTLEPAYHLLLDCLPLNRVLWVHWVQLGRFLIQASEDSSGLGLQGGSLMTVRWELRWDCWFYFL